MTEQNYSVDQTSDEGVQPRMNAMSSAVPETPSGDMQVKTPYDYLKEAFEKEIANDPVTLEVPNRPGIYIEFDTNITSEQMDLWRKQASLGNRRQRRQGGGEPEIDSVKFASLVVLNKATHFVINGDYVYLDPPQNRQPLNFFEQAALKQIVGTNATTDTELVRDVYRNDAHVLSAGGQIIEEAGYGEELDEMQESPTRR